MAPVLQSKVCFTFMQYSIYLIIIIITCVLFSLSGSDELQIREFTMTYFPISRTDVICNGLENDIEECQSSIVYDVNVEEGDEIVTMNCNSKNEHICSIHENSCS